MPDIHFAVDDGPFRDPLCDADLARVAWVATTYDPNSVSCEDCLELLELVR